MTLALPEQQLAPATFAPAPVARPSIADKLAYCHELAQSGMLPRHFIKQPANLLYAVEYADSLGLHPMVAITGVHVIEGKPSASSALISALVRRAGHKLRVKGDARSAVAQIVRADDPDWTFEVRFTIEDAQRARLTGKDVWQKYPASMLKARAISAVARDACEEALFGIHYTPEELGAVVDQEGNPVYIQGEVQRDGSGEQPAGPSRDFIAEAMGYDGTTEPDLDSIINDARTEGAPAHYLAQLEAIQKAYAAPDAAAVRELYDEAKEMDAPAEQLSRLASIGATKPGARLPQQQGEGEQPPADENEHQEQVAESEQDQEHAAERAAMYDAAKAAGLSNAEADQAFAAQHQCPPAAATVEQLRTQRDDLLAVMQQGATA